MKELERELMEIASTYFETVYKDNRETMGTYLSPSSYAKSLADTSDTTVVACAIRPDYKTLGVSSSRLGKTQHATVELGKTAKEVDNTLPDVVCDYIDNLTANTLADLDLTNAEYELDVNGYFNDLYFEGTADIIIHNADGTITVADLKNYANQTEYDINVAYHQLAIYASLVAAKYNKPIKELVMYNPMTRLKEVWPC